MIFKVSSTDMADFPCNDKDSRTLITTRNNHIDKYESEIGKKKKRQNLSGNSVELANKMNPSL